MLERHHILTDLEINMWIAKNTGLSYYISDNKVILYTAIPLYELEEGQEFTLFDGLMRSKAICLDLLSIFSVSFTPKHEGIDNLNYAFCLDHVEQRYGLAQSTIPTYDKSVIRAVCVSIISTHSEELFE